VRPTGRKGTVWTISDPSWRLLVIAAVFVVAVTGYVLTG